MESRQMAPYFFARRVEPGGVPRVRSSSGRRALERLHLADREPRRYLEIPRWLCAVPASDARSDPPGSRGHRAHGHPGEDGMASSCHSRRAHPVACQRDFVGANAVSRRRHGGRPPLLRFDLCRAWCDGRSCSGPCAHGTVYQVVPHRANRPCDIVCAGFDRTGGATPHRAGRATAVESQVCGRANWSRRVRGGNVRPQPVESRRAGARGQ